MMMDTYNVCLSIFMMCNLVIYLATSQITNVNTTQQCSSAYDDRCQEIMRYHCLKTVNGTLVEMCSAPIYFNPLAGCPVYNGSVMLLYERCTSDGCPPKNETEPISLGKLFKYPACLKPPLTLSNTPESRPHGHLNPTSLSTGSPESPSFQRNISEENVSTSFALTLDASEAVNRRPNQEKSAEMSIFENPVLKTAGILVFVFVLGNIIIIVVVVKMIKKRNRKATFSGGEMSELPNESTEQIYNTVDETCLAEAV